MDFAPGSGVQLHDNPKESDWFRVSGTVENSTPAAAPGEATGAADAFLDGMPEERKLSSMRGRFTSLCTLLRAAALRPLLLSRRVL